MPKGGQLTMDTALVNLDEPSAKEIPDARAGSFVCFSITDTGLGIGADLLPHIFEPFYNTIGLGSGLGLSVIHGIVHQHHGWINVFSREGHGSTFRVYLPALPADTPQASSYTAPVAGSAALGRGERILLVDDEKALRTRAQELLRSSGYEVLAAGSAEEALALFKQENGRFDVLFSDIVLPGENGISLAEQLRRRDSRLLILLVSGYSDHRTRWPAIQEQQFGFLQKPYLAADLLGQLRQELDKRQTS